MYRLELPIGALSYVFTVHVGVEGRIEGVLHRVGGKAVENGSLVVASVTANVATGLTYVARERCHYDSY